MSIVLVILDGAPDRPNPELGMKTPLQAAHMPNLQKLSNSAYMGMMYPVGKGIAPESDEAVFSILGYSLEGYTGRGPIEAFGAGLKVYDNSLALRANFATISDDKTILDRRAGRSITKKEAKSLERIINRIKLSDGTRFAFRATVGHRGAIVFYSKRKMSANISNIDIGYIKKGSISIAVQSQGNQKLPKSMPLDKTHEASYTADLLNEFEDKATEALANAKINELRKKKGLPEANALLLRDAGIGLPHVKLFDKKFGIKSAFITEMPVETGIAKVLGMREIRVKSEEGHSVEKYKKIAKEVNKRIKVYDLIYVHLKGPDEPGHDGNSLLKKQVLEEIDEGFFASIDRNELICVTADHSTPCTLKAHSADPVPVMAYCSNIKNPDKIPFDERIGNKGSLGIFYGKELIKKLLSMEKRCPA